MTLAALWLILAAAVVADTAPSQPADGIPPALRKVTECMVEAAKATPGVLSAERGVSSQDGEAFVDVTYKYRTDDGLVAVASYSRPRDEMQLDKVGGMRAEKPFVLFESILPGVLPECDVIDRNDPAKRTCAPGPAPSREPIPGWGTHAVRSAWERSCGVATISLAF